MKKKWRSFEEARKFARSLKLTHEREWNNFCKSEKLPYDIPKTPRYIYKDKWKGTGEWLGTGRIANQLLNFLLYKEARKFAHTLNLENKKDWKKFVKAKKHPKDIPTDPQSSYKNKGWTDWGDFLGTGNIASYNRKYKSYKLARKYVISLKIDSKGNWAKYTQSGKLPPDIPNNPDVSYKNKGWKDWGDFLGTGTIAPQLISKNYISLKEAKKEARKIKLELFGKRRITRKEWEQAYKKGKIPKFLPEHPGSVYGKIKRNRK